MHADQITDAFLENRFRYKEGADGQANEFDSSVLRSSWPTWKIGVTAVCAVLVGLFFQAMAEASENKLYVGVVCTLEESAESLAESFDERGSADSVALILQMSTDPINPVCMDHMLVYNSAEYLPIDMGDKYQVVRLHVVIQDYSKEGVFFDIYTFFGVVEVQGSDS